MEQRASARFNCQQGQAQRLRMQTRLPWWTGFRQRRRCPEARAATGGGHGGPPLLLVYPGELQKSRGNRLIAPAF
jgi:hypothetical protein